MSNTPAPPCSWTPDIMSKPVTQGMLFAMLGNVLNGNFGSFRSPEDARNVARFMYEELFAINFGLDPGTRALAAPAYVSRNELYAAIERTIKCSAGPTLWSLERLLDELKRIADPNSVQATLPVSPDGATPAPVAAADCSPQDEAAQSTTAPGSVAGVFERDPAERIDELLAANGKLVEEARGHKIAYENALHKIDALTAALGMQHITINAAKSRIGALQQRLSETGLGEPHSTEAA